MHLFGYWPDQNSQKVSDFQFTIFEFPVKEGIYSLQLPPEGVKQYAVDALFLSSDEASSKQNAYTTSDNTAVGKLIIESLDTDKGIIKGSFEFTGVNQNGAYKQVSKRSFNMRFDKQTL